MTSIDYPSVLPSLLISGYSYKTDSAFIRSEMEQGPARQRKRFTRTPTIVTGTFLMSEGELSYFESWFDNEIDFGVQWFNIDIKVGAGFVSHVARFIDTPNIASNQTLFNVSVKLELEQKQVDTLLNSDQLAYIEAQGGFDEADLSLDYIETYVNEYLEEVF